MLLVATYYPMIMTSNILIYRNNNNYYYYSGKLNYRKLFNSWAPVMLNIQIAKFTFVNTLTILPNFWYSPKFLLSYDSGRAWASPEYTRDRKRFYMYILVYCECWTTQERLRSTTLLVDLLSWAWRWLHGGLSPGYRYLDSWWSWQSVILWSFTLIW